MMKPRTSRVANERSTPGAHLAAKSELAIASNGAPAQRNPAQLSSNNQQTSAQVIRKRRSSINVYDQPSSLNSRLRQLETDMLRLDEDRTKLFDDTHSALAQYELRLNEIHAILKSRQDNVEKYVEDMKLLLIAKEEFEKQAKLLNEKHDRIHEKFMHRETTISREIKLLKNKFEALEKNRQFRSILQKSAGSASFSDNNNNTDDLTNGLNDFNESLGQKSGATSEAGSEQLGRVRSASQQAQQSTSRETSKPSKLSGFGWLGRLLNCLLRRGKRPRVSIGRQWNNRISSSLTSEIDPPPHSAAVADDNHQTTEGRRNSEKLNQQRGAAGSIELIKEDINGSIKQRQDQHQQMKQQKVGLFKRLFT